jgi:hypothetical protein
MIASRPWRRFALTNGRPWGGRAALGSVLMTVGLAGCGSQGPDIAGVHVAGDGVAAPSAAFDYAHDDAEQAALAEATDQLAATRLGGSGDKFMIDGFRLPVEDQLDAGSCLYMAGTGIMEWLINKHLAVTAPAIDSPTDLSERYLLTLASRIGLANNFTDVVYLFRSAGTYVLDRDLRFLKRNGSTQVNWTPVDERPLPRKTDLPSFTRKVLFTSNGNQMANGVMHDADLATIKQELKTRQSPVLFVYHPPTVSWWHANVIVGYDDARQVFYARDSAFGAARADLPHYGYGTATTADDGDYLDIYELSYAQAKAWGNHASIYSLTE